MTHSQTTICMRERCREAGLSRRQFLRAATATTAAVSIAGCLGGSDDDEQSPGEGNGTDDDGTETPTGSVPESFAGRDRQRELTREYVRLLAGGEFETASEWISEDAPGSFTANTLEQSWNLVVGGEATVDSIDSVSYFGTETGDDLYRLRATLDGDRYEFLVGFSESGISAFSPGPIGEWTPPAYVDESSFSEEELSLETPLDCELGATVTIPETDGQVPGVVVVHGNGPSTRDGVVGPNRTYKELAWGLASKGIAVLRYDKRTFACEPDFSDVTIDDVVTEDAVTAITALRSHERVADDQVFVAGHSFGGALAPRIAKRDGNLAGTIMLAPGPSESFADLIVRQTEHLLELSLVPESRRDQQLEAVRQEAEKMRTLDIGDDEVVRFGGREFHRSLQEYDQTGAAASLEIPLLLLQGGQDWQVTVEEQLPPWRDALGDKKNAEIKVYDDLNHLFQPSEGQRTRAEYLLDKSVDERIIDDIATFVTETTGQSTQQVLVPSA